jgi:DNA-binding beta-propeller fold protein YncE
MWPQAPQLPRISYLYSVSRPEEAGINGSWFSRFIGSFRGGVDKQISKPYGLVYDDQGALYVVDNDCQKVHVFDKENDRHYRFPEDAPDGFVNPVGIALGTDGRIFVSDSVGQRVHVFSEAGKKYLGAAGERELERPTGIAINNTTSELLVLDTRLSRLFVYDLKNLMLKRVIGDQNDGSADAPTFHFPTNIFVSADGSVHVTDSLNFRIQIFSEDLKLRREFGAAGDMPGNFSRPKGIATDSDGNIYVVDALFDNVQIFDPQGSLLLAFGGPGSAPGEFWLPNAIHIDANDRIYISDAYNGRVQVFQYLTRELAGL